MLSRQLAAENKKITTFFCVLLLAATLALTNYHYSAGYRWAASVAAKRHYLNWQSAETRYFHLRYTKEDEEFVSWLAEHADQAVLEVGGILPHNQTGRPWLILAPDQTTIQKIFGWGEGMGALGVYQAQTIILLSPDAWLWEKAGERKAAFAVQNPLVHEYTHYVLDVRTKGNYPRWFSEGLAQLLEYEIMHYEWLENGSSLEHAVYLHTEMEKDFDRLPNQAKAYRQAFSMVSYLVELKGFEGINNLVDQLGKGKEFRQALLAVYAVDWDTFFAEWQKWYINDSRWYAIQ